MKKINLITAILMMQIICMGQIINVPDDQPTIQAGINAAMDGDTVLVEDSTYYENIKFMGKAITVASRFIIDGDESHIDNTIIDGSSATNPDSASTVMFINFEDTTSIICGFTIQGGAGLVNTTWDIRYGGGIACWESGPKIQHNIIKDNLITDPSLVCGGVGIGSFSETGNWWMVVDNCEITDNVCIANAEATLGGGIFVMTNTIIKNNSIENNSSMNVGGESHGGGIKVHQPEGTTITAEIHDNIIQHNTAEGHTPFGGGIMFFNAGGEIINNVINYNESIADEDAHGSAMYFYNSTSEIQIIGNDISNNNCIGIRAYSTFRIVNPMGEILIMNNTISGNNCTGEQGTLGAGFSCYIPTDKIRILNNDINNNTASGEIWAFGGVWIWDAEDNEVVVDGNIFKNNTATNVGGFYARNSYNLTLSNNLFSENDVTKHGGAIYFHQYYESDNEGIYSSPAIHNIPKTTNNLENLRPLIINNTFNDNHAGELGGAIYATSNCDSLTPVIINNIFWNNVADSLGNDIRHGGDETIFVGYNDLDTNGIWGNWTGENNIDVDPLFIDEICHVDENSECIEAGVISIEINGLTYDCPDHDFDGQLRPLNATADIGLDEVLISGIISRFDKTVRQTSLDIYPNPFSNQTTIEFTLPNAEFVTLSVYDITGKRLKTILSEKLSKGNHKINWNAQGLNEGIYFIRLETQNRTQVHKALILR